MLTAFDKALVPIVGALVVYINQHYGWHLPADDVSLQALFAGVSAIVVYFIPNKAQS